MSNLLTKYLKEGMVIKCTERYHLVGLEDAGVNEASQCGWLPCYIKIIKAPEGVDSLFDFKVSIRPKKSNQIENDFSDFIPYDKFCVQCAEKDGMFEKTQEFTTRDVLNELYLIKQENGDINELFDFFVSNDVDKLIDYLYENKMERLAEKEEDLTF